MGAYDELDALKARLDSHRPIEPEKLRAVREKFRLEWTYHSNALEGNPLTLSETAFFIRAELTSKGRPLSAYLEAKNHAATLDFLEGIVSDKEPLTELLIKQYHSMLFDNIDHVEIGSGPDRQSVPVEAGRYKQRNNHVVRLDGRILEFTDPLHVPEEMEQLIQRYGGNATKLHAIDLATIFHHRFVRIHPFVDGNGRTARLLMNTILMQAGYTPAIIPVEERERYLKALQAADDGHHQSFLTFVEELVNGTLRLMIDVIEGREAFDFDDLAKMFGKIAEGAKASEEELGRAVTPPEGRAVQTGAQIANWVAQMVRRHAEELKAPNVQVGLGQQTGLPGEVWNHKLWRELTALVHGQNAVNLIPQLSLRAGNRVVPTLIVTFPVMSGRYQVALAGFAALGKFNESNVEVAGAEILADKLLGSIYLEDWNQQAVSEFVIGTLKTAYRAWSAEMERRRSLIAAEEAEVSKFRPQR